MKPCYIFSNEEVAKKFDHISSANLKKATKDFLSEYGISYASLARKVDLHETYISKWLKGKLEIGVRSEERIFDYLYRVFPQCEEYLEKKII